MKIDFSPLQPFMDELLRNLLMVLVIPLVGALILKFILVKLKVPDYFSALLSSFAFLYFAYKMFIIVTE